MAYNPFSDLILIHQNYSPVFNLLNSSIVNPLPPLKPTFKCPICLSFLCNSYGPNSCPHKFCYRCISKWGYMKRCCPICRMSFTSIINKNAI